MSNQVKLSADEEFLAGEAGTVRLLVGRPRIQPSDKLDWSAKLHCAKQSAADEKGRRRSFLPQR